MQLEALGSETEGCDDSLSPTILKNAILVHRGTGRDNDEKHTDKRDASTGGIFQCLEVKRIVYLSFASSEGNQTFDYFQGSPKAIERQTGAEQVMMHQFLIEDSGSRLAAVILTSFLTPRNIYSHNLLRKRIH